MEFLYQKEAKMDNSLKQRVTHDLNEWLNKEGNTLGSLANKVGENRAYLSKIKNGEYAIDQGDRKATVIADRVYFKMATAIGKPFVDRVHFDTKNFQIVKSAAAYARSTKRRVLLWGEDSGASKTYGLEWVALNEPNTVYIKVFSNMIGRELIDVILKAMRVKTDIKSNLKKLKLIAETVITKNYLIIIDEMEYAKAPLYKVIKDLVDYTYGKAGLILCGTDLEPEMRKAALRKKALMPQVYRRFRGSIRKLKNFSRSDVNIACEQFKITDREVIKYINMNVYDMGMLAEWFEDIKAELLEKGEPITVENLKQLFES